MKKFVLASVGIGTAVTVTLAFDAPPAIPAGPVSYDSVDYSNSDADLYAFHNNEAVPTDWQTEAVPESPTPISSLDSTDKRFSMNINMYTSNYTVRGMGVNDIMSEFGYSSVDVEYTFANRNLFGLGIYQQVNGTFGVIWGSSSELGDTPIIRGGYALGKEIFPNLHWTVGYNLQHGGLQGYMAKATDKCSQRITQDIYTTLKFDDNQQGFFGQLTLGCGFQGLTGIYADLSGGYRMVDIINGNNLGADVELEAGIAYSNDYWVNGAEGVDAYRVRASLKPYSKSGTFGRESNKSFTPWVMMSFGGNNENNIDRAFGHGVIDECQFTVGVDFGWTF